MWGNPTLSENKKIAAENFVETESAITIDNDSTRSQTLTTMAKDIKLIGGARDLSF